MNESYGFTSFVCGHCRTEIEASLDMIGECIACPACGARLVVPPQDDVRSRPREIGDDPDLAQALKGRTIRIELDDL